MIVSNSLARRKGKAGYPHSLTWHHGRAGVLTKMELQADTGSEHRLNHKEKVLRVILHEKV